MMKAQIFQISFIIFALIFFLLSLYLAYFQFGKRAEEISVGRIVDIFDNIRNVINSYAKLSLYYATTQNFREESHTWIHNGFNPLEFEFLKECKENLTTFYLNQYLSKFYINLPLNIEIKKVEKCNFDLTRESVFSGKNDEGNFSVTCNSTMIKIYINDTFLLSFLNSSNFITNNRYWYLYRKFYEWAQENGDKFAACVCALVNACANCVSIETCYQGLLESLKAKFEDDKYVECYTEPSSCCYQEFGDPCKLPDGCQSWQNRCYVANKYECKLPIGDMNYQNLANSNNIDIQYSMKEVKSVSSDFYCESCKWIENRMETNRRYWCIDRKYYESSPSGPQPITFTATVYAGFKDYVSCLNLVKNNCNPENAKCNGCRDVDGKTICDRCILDDCENNGCIRCWLECEECEIQNNKVEGCKRCESKTEIPCPA